METQAVTMQDLDALRKEMKKMKRHPAADSRWIVPALIGAAMALLLFVMDQNSDILKDLSKSRLETTELINASRLETRELISEMKEQFSASKFDNEKRFNELDRKLDKIQTSIDCLRQKK